MRPGTKVLGRPLACISISRSLVMAVSPTCARMPRSSR
ncbi:Uncharacterised protein [Bordetella pertussis]|nr:Uncharacterised protein [Bordetella pertussis]